MPRYVLEVQRYDVDANNTHPEWCGRCEHIGYMNYIFETKQKACDYYDKYNPHLRSLNAHNTWRSDWDPDTKLLYVVREHNSEYLKIPPFNINDSPSINITKNWNNNNIINIKYPKINY